MRRQRRSHGFLCRRQLPLAALGSKVALLCMDDGQSGQFAQSRSERGETNTIGEINRRHKKQLHKSRVSVFPFALCFLFILIPTEEPDWLDGATGQLQFQKTAFCLLLRANQHREERNESGKTNPEPLLLGTQYESCRCEDEFLSD